MNLGDTIRSGVRWTMVGKFGHQILGFLFGIVLARLLAPADFGMLVTVQIFTGIAGFVAGGGMGQALVRAKEATKSDYDTVFTLQLGIGCLIYIVFFFAAPGLATWYDTPVYETLLRISALSFILRPFNNLPGNILHRDMRFKAQAFVGITTLIVTNSISIALAWLGYGVWSLILSGFAGSLVGIFLQAHLAGWRPGFRLDWQRGRDLARYGFLVSANDIVVYLRRQTSNFIIGRFIGPVAVGLYNKASSLNDMPSGTISNSAYGVVFRALARTQDNRDQSKYIYLRTITLVTVYTLPFYVGLWWVAELFITTVYGQKWAGAAPVLEILALAGLFMCINNQSGAVTAARQLLGPELVVQLVGWALLIVGVAIGYRWGISGVAWAMVVVSAIMAGLMARLASRELRVRFREFGRALQPALLLNTILCIGLFALHTWVLAPFKPVQPALYLIAMAAAGGLLYSTCFLYLPIPQLTKEATRWKTRLGLPTKPVAP